MTTVRMEPDSDAEIYSLPCNNETKITDVKQEELHFPFAFVEVKTEVEDELYDTSCDVLGVPVEHSEHRTKRGNNERQNEYAERKRLLKGVELDDIPAKQKCDELVPDIRIKHDLEEEISIQEHGICSESVQTASLVEFARLQADLDVRLSASDQDVQHTVTNYDVTPVSRLDVQPISAVVAHFQNEVMNLVNIQSTSPNKIYLGKLGEPSRAFFLYLFMDKSLALRFLRTSHLIKSEMQCYKCGQQMELTLCEHVNDGERWECTNSLNTVVGDKNIIKQCKGNRSIRHNSWFMYSNLTLLEILLITYEILHRTLPDDIEREYHISNDPQIDWSHFCREVMINFIETNSQKVGGVGKVVEIYKNKFGKNKYNFRHHMKGQWVFVGVERDSEKAFLVVVQNRKPETLVCLIKEWIKFGSKIMTDSWQVKDSLGADYCADLWVNHSILFIAGDSGASKNTISSLWRRARVSDNCNKQVDFMHFLAQYTFRKNCAANGENIFNKFIEVIRNIEWSEEE